MSNVETENGRTGSPNVPKEGLGFRRNGVEPRLGGKNSLLRFPVIINKAIIFVFIFHNVFRFLYYYNRTTMGNLVNVIQLKNIKMIH